jgi:alkylated DNA repair dioxygenase AlkB
VRPLQGSFIDGTDDVAIAPIADGLDRHALGDGAWFDLRRGWVTGSDSLFARLDASVPWRAERRRMYGRIVEVPRLVAHYGEGVPLPEPILEQASVALNDFYRSDGAGPFVTATMCLYRDGRDSVAWHGDRIGRGATENVLVAIVSVGAPRRLLLRSRSGGASRAITLGRGDLFVMGGTCQRTWDHAVPKSTRTEGARISVQFRPHDTR